MQTLYGVLKVGEKLSSGWLTRDPSLRVKDMGPTPFHFVAMLESPQTLPVQMLDLSGLHLICGSCLIEVQIICPHLDPRSSSSSSSSWWATPTHSCTIG